MDVQRLGRAEPVRVPHLVDQALPRDDGARVPHQELEQLKLLAAQLQRPSVQRRLVPGRVEPQRADLQGPFAGLARDRGAAQHGPDARDHLAGAERLDHIVVGAELEPDHPIGLFPAGGEHDDRHLRAGAQLSAHVEAGPIREHHVEEDKVGIVTGELERLGDSACHLRLEALAQEGLGQRLVDRGLVLDQEDRALRPAAHACELFPLAPKRRGGGRSEE